MEMTLLSITVWLIYFLGASAQYFNTLPTSTMSDYTETPQITPATATSTTKTNQEPKIPINATDSSRLTTTTQDSTTNLPSEVHTQSNTTQNVTSTKDTTSLDQHNSSTSSQNGMMDDDVGVSNASNVAISHMNTSHNTTVSTSIAKLTPQNNETGTVSSASYTDDGKTAQTADALSDLLKSVSTVPWKDWTEKDDDRTKADEGNYETNSTQATFANTNKSRGTWSTEGSYNFTSEHREEPYDTTANTISVSAATATVRNDWSTSQKTDIPMITAAATVTDAPEYHTSIGGVNHSTQQNRFTNSTAHTERENITGKDTPSGTTNYNNNSTITDVLTDATTNKTNKTDTDSKVWPTCLNPNSESQSHRSTLVCFITVWTLAMTATLFLGITIFLWVRISVFKKKMKRRKKGGQTCEKESLWADPKASVQERVEFWYVSGSTMEADRKQKDRKKQERMKKRGREQDSKENGLWIQPRVTVDDITDFWYANRRMKEERMQDILS